MALEASVVDSLQMLAVAAQAVENVVLATAELPLDWHSNLALALEALDSIEAAPLAALVVVALFVVDISSVAWVLELDATVEAQVHLEADRQMVVALDLQKVVDSVAADVVVVAVVVG